MPVSAALRDGRVAMDGRMLVQQQATGVATYARGLRRALAQIVAQPLLLSDRADLAGAEFEKRGAPSQGRARRWLRALWPGPHQATASAAGGAALLVAPDIFRVAQVHFDLYRRLLPIAVAGPPGLIHWTYPVPLRILGWANLYTVHDVIPLLQPALSPIDPIRHRRLLAAITRSAAALVTVSDSAAADIAAVLGYPADRIHNCAQAVAPAPAPGALPPGLAPGAYLLALGSVERRKNLEALQQAHRQSGVSLPLVIAGPDGWGSAAAGAANLIRLPYLPRAQVGALIAQARAVLMPSLAEGFGLPVIEAMALGTPVLTSAGGALEETAGGAALLVDPRDPAAMAAAIVRIVGDAALRARLIAAGRVNAGRFTDARFAERLAPLYEQQLAQLAR